MSSAAITPSQAPRPAWPVFVRFAWKEFRRMQGFALGVAALSLMLMLMVRSLYGGSHATTHPDLPIAMLMIALGGGAFVAVGGAITAFAVEREEQTITFLRSLPRYWPATLAGKATGVLVIALVFAAAMTPVGWLAASFTWLTGADLRQSLLHGLTMVLEAWSWGLVVSLLLPRPLLAAVVACGVASLSQQIALALHGSATLQTESYVEAVPHRLMLVGLALLLSAPLARRWLLSPGVTRRRARGRRKTVSVPAPADVGITPAAAQKSLVPLAPTKHRDILWRLSWQTLRESWRAMLAVVLVGLFLTISVDMLHGYRRQGMWAQLPLTVFFIPGLCGALVFRQDHRRGQYQFLAEHAGRARLVWLVRLAVWGLYLTLLIAPILLMTLVLLPYTSTLGFTRLDLLHYVVVNFALAAVAAFAFGQLASLLLKSDILAAGTSLFGSCAILALAYLIAAWRLPPLWCWLLGIVGCLLATWFRVPGWLAGRNTPGGWSVVAGSVLLPAAIVLATIPAMRHSQISHAIASFAATNFSEEGGVAGSARLDSAERVLDDRIDQYQQQQAAAAKVTAEYQSVLADIRQQEEARLPADAAVLKDDQSGQLHARTVLTGIADGAAAAYPEKIKRLIALTREPAAEVTPATVWINEVTALLAADFRHAMVADELDRAWQCLLAIQWFKSQLLHDGTMLATYVLQNLQFEQYAPDDLLVEWALAEGQTADRIWQAVRDLEAVQQSYPQVDQYLVAQYLVAQDVLEGGQPAGFPSDWPPLSDLALFLDQLPGEHARARDALQLMTLLSIDHVDRGLELGGEQLRRAVAPQFAVEQYYLDSDPPLLRDRQQRLWSTAMSSRLASEVWNGFIGSAEQIAGAQQVHIRAELEQIRLGLIAYHLQHGEYPATLRQVHLEALPLAFSLDPYSRDYFQYASRHMEKGMWGEAKWKAYAREHDLAPMIWSVGSANVTSVEVEIDPASPPQTPADLSVALRPLEVPGGEPIARGRSLTEIPPDLILLKLPRDEEYAD